MYCFTRQLSSKDWSNRNVLSGPREFSLDARLFPSPARRRGARATQWRARFRGRSSLPNHLALLPPARGTHGAGAGRRDEAARRLRGAARAHSRGRRNRAAFRSRRRRAAVTHGRATPRSIPCALNLSGSRAVSRASRLRAKHTSQPPVRAIRTCGVDRLKRTLARKKGPSRAPDDARRGPRAAQWRVRFCGCWIPRVARCGFARLGRSADRTRGQKVLPFVCGLSLLP